MKSPQVDPIGNLTIGVGLQFLSLATLRTTFELRAFIINKNL